jgi:hypothetical protein
MPKKNSHLKKLFMIGAVAFWGPFLLIAPEASGQLPSKIKADDLAYRETMIKMSRQLGVTCATCHNTNDFASAEKLEFKMAKEHIRITQALIDAGFDGQGSHPMADCFMCHRGKIKPDFKEPFDPMTMKKNGDSKSELDKKATEKTKEEEVK